MTQVGRVLGWTLLLFLLPLSALLGSIGSVVASIMAILLLPFALNGGAWPALRTQPALLLFAMVFVALGAMFALNASAPQDLLFAVNFISLLLAAPVYLVARRVEAAERPVLTIAILCLAGALVALLVSASDVWLRGLVRAEGYFMGGNLLARLALLMGFLALAGLFVTRSGWRYLLYLGPLAGIATTMLTQTRGAFLEIPVLGLILAGTLAVDRRDRWQLVLLGLLAVVAVAALGLFSNRLSGILTIFSDLLSGGATSDSTSGQRLDLLRAALSAFLADPLTGHGWAWFARTASPYMDLEIYGGITPDFQFHNDLANFAVAAGIVGIAAWLALSFAPLIGMVFTPRDALFRVRLYCLLVLVGATLVSGLTDFTLGYDLPTTLYAFLTAIVLGAFREKRA